MPVIDAHKYNISHHYAGIRCNADMMGTILKINII